MKEDGDDGPIESIKIRQSQAIDKLGTFATCASIFKTFVGLGILFQPYQYWLVGIANLPIFHLTSLFLSLYCARLLFRCADNHGESYSELAFKSYGRPMQIITECLIIAAQFGFCTNYVYFITS